MERLPVQAGLISVTVMLGFSQMHVPRAHAEPGLLIIAHGAPTTQWNAPVLELGRRVAAQAHKDGRFKAVRTAFLECAQPDLPGAIAELEAEGCDRIIAVPLFIAPSGHSHFDVPAVLGIYSSREIKAVIAKEGGRIAQPNVPITLTETLDGSNILPAFALDQVRKLSESPADEALILIAHGDPGHQRLVDRMMRRTMAYCCAHAGIDYADWAFVGMGQEYMDAVHAVLEALEHKKRVLVVGLYVSSSAKSINRRAMRIARSTSKDTANPLEGKPVVFSEQGVISHDGVVEWVLDSATAALAPLPSDHGHAENPLSRDNVRESTPRPASAWPMGLIPLRQIVGRLSSAKMGA